MAGRSLANQVSTINMLSVVLAIHNEAKNLPACLAAIEQLADEVVIVDGESSDNSAQIARQFGAQVFTTTNKPNFHIHKQLAMDKATGELILQLDADEIVDDELANWIRKLRTQIDSKQPPSEVAWWIKRKNLFLGSYLKKGGQYPDPVIRLYRRGKARLPQQDVHEQMTVDGPIGWAEGHLLHNSNPSFSDYLRKFDTYTSFKAQQLYAQKLTISLWHSLLYICLKPSATFISLYIRHRGYVDGIPGFVFAVGSGLHHLIAYLKLWEMYAQH